MPPEFSLLAIWVATVAVSAASWPAAAMLFGASHDRGYALAKIIGLVVVSYAAFALATLRIAALTPNTIFAILAVWFGMNVWIEFRWKVLRERAIPWRSVAAAEILFFGLMALWALVRSHEPFIYGVERFPDFGFLRALANAGFLPLEDPWYAGEPVNYYYFGHAMARTLLEVARVSLVPGFFLVVAWMFGLLGSVVYWLGYEGYGLISSRLPRSRPPLRLRRRAIIAGGISAFAVLMAGTWHVLPWLFASLKAMTFSLPRPYYWYPVPTRIIPNTITEMPFYGFLEGDLHPHMWGLVIGSLILATLFFLWRDADALTPGNKRLWFLTFLVGVAYMTNAWDILTLGPLIATVLVFKLRGALRVVTIAAVLLVPMGAFLVAAPWSFSVSPPIEGIGIVRTRSPFLPWLSFWGAPLAIPILAAGYILIRRRRNVMWSRGYVGPFLLPLAIIAISLVLLALLEVFYVREYLEETVYFRSNTLFKVSYQVWLWLGVITGPLAVAAVSAIRKKWLCRAFVAVVMLLLLAQAVYPILAVSQARLSGKKRQSLANGLVWWQGKSPGDFAAYEFLAGIRDRLPPDDRVRRLVEAEGESFTDAARFSTFLGWPTILGWAMHERAWRGSWDGVMQRRDEVREIYTGPDREITRNILEKYRIDYLIVGQVEQERYGEYLNVEKLSALGRTVFESGGTRVIRVGRR